MSLGNIIERRETPSHTARSIIASTSVGATENTKKDMKINLRIREDLWKTFAEDCQARGTSASAEIRRFIEQQLGL
ncbi:MAG: hypothetical protein K2G44_04960 [Clostridia bacterium]|nr:hypothetical protein [Clostridia bacterium]